MGIQLKDDFLWEALECLLSREGAGWVYPGLSDLGALSHNHSEETCSSSATGQVIPVKKPYLVPYLTLLVLFASLAALWISSSIIRWATKSQSRIAFPAMA